MAAHGFRTRVVQPLDKPPYVRVVNMECGELAEDISVGQHNGEAFYRYSWGQPICPVRHMSSAVERVSHVLTPERSGKASRTGSRPA
ncbi:hypothetical protein DFJ69_4612 [Thermomonospora umbrina]|uniref:Uncharacterized protein n=1 Tax=Thermomonospora umbrina TaxID=111806 RepID=A0A3D9ST04_9ACTN|nr:hypothetical protein DFJ69_4612 [Thermomonospora umbrina]